MIYFVKRLLPFLAVAAMAACSEKPKPAPNPSVPTASSGWKEYGSMDASGNPVSGHHSYGKVLSASEAEAFSSKEVVLGK
jgi:hypothetical protein